MEMPDTALMMHIKLRCAFLDKKSKEKDTERVKAKYKLLTQKGTILSEIGIFIFHVLTTTEDSYIKDKTINIYKTDWEYIDGTHLYKEYSKLCSQEVDIMNEEKILSKIKDSENRFSHTGTLSHLKFNEVVNFIRESFETTDTKTNFEVKDILKCLINKENIADDLLIKYNL